MNTVFDPLRRKEVAATPEEQVRQWFISQLRDTAGVPLHMMGSEVAFMFGAKKYRADILVFNRSAEPLAVVECKRPDVRIDASVAEQAMRYNAVLSVKYIFLTNGATTFIFKRNADRFEPCSVFPEWNSMLDEQD